MRVNNQKKLFSLRSRIDIRSVYFKTVANFSPHSIRAEAPQMPKFLDVEAVERSDVSRGSICQQSPPAVILPMTRAK
jgi:hypothetical protein